MAEKNIPEIRFDGFSEKWESKLAESLCSISTGKSNTQDNVKDGQYPFYVRSAKIERSNKYLFEEEAVLTVGDGVGTGKVYHYVNGKYDLHQRVYRMYDFKEVTGKFFYYIFSENFQKRVSAMTAKTSVDSVRMEMISKMKISFPVKLEEQKKIDGIFTHLNNLIANHQTQHKKLKTLKKAMLSKLFPKQGETVPEIRFKGFSGEWEVKNLGDIGSFFSGGTPLTSNKSYYGGSIPFIRSGEIHSSSTELFITKEGLDNSSAKMIKKGDLLIALYGATSGEISICNIEGAINQAILCIKTSKNKKFINCIWEKDKVEILNTYLQGGQGNLSSEIVKNVNFFFPSIEEQEKIGSYFENIDSLIENHHKQIEKLSVLKKACLSKMFV